MLEKERKRAAVLRQELTRHRHLYYNEEAEISDGEYDALEQELQELEKKYPDASDNILQQVGAKPAGTFSAARHDPPMLSLQKAHQQEEIVAFLQRFQGKPMSLWPKFDGVSLSLLYRNGQLERAATRGDGRIGEEITDNVRALVEGVPEKLNSKWSGEVRGEVVMPLATWQEYNRLHPDTPLANARNAASGTLRSKEPAKVADRQLLFYAYDLLPSTSYPVKSLQTLGFTIQRYREANSLQEVMNYVNELQQDRDKLSYQVDGVVIRLRDSDDYQQAGWTSHHPRGALAYKLASKAGESILNSVVWQVGKSGIVAPVGVIDPVFLAGSTISRASLHNLQVIKERDIRLYDRVLVERAGDVIPRIIAPANTRKRTGKEKKIRAINRCPSCQGPLLKQGSSDILYCQNSQGCQAQLLRRLVHWASRAGADIDALGEKWTSKLLAAGLVQYPSDFYRLDADTLEQTFAGQGMRRRLAEKIVAAVQVSKELGLKRALVALAIPLVSEGTAERLCLAGYQSLEEIAAASEEELCRIPDLGPVVAHSLHSFFSSPETKKELARLRSVGVVLQVLPEDQKQAGSRRLAGKTVVISGKLSLPRADYKQLLQEAGAKVTTSVSTNTDYLLAGSGSGIKLKRAQQLGVSVINEKELQKIMGPA